MTAAVAAALVGVVLKVVLVAVMGVIEVAAVAAVLVMERKELMLVCRFQFQDESGTRRRANSSKAFCLSSRCWPGDVKRDDISIEAHRLDQISCDRAKQKVDEVLNPRSKPMRSYPL